MAEFDVTVRIRKQFVVRAQDEHQAASLARMLVLDGAEQVTEDDIRIDVEYIDR